jgi:hypothetical protein
MVLSPFFEPSFLDSGPLQKICVSTYRERYGSELVWREVLDGQGFALKMRPKLGQKWLGEGESPNGVSFVSR